MGEFNSDESPRKDLGRTRLTHQEIVEAAKLRRDMYDYLLTKLGDDSNSMAETILSFLEHERDAWLDLLPEEQRNELLTKEEE